MGEVVAVSAGREAKADERGTRVRRHEVAVETETKARCSCLTCKLWSDSKAMLCAIAAKR